MIKIKQPLCFSEIGQKDNQEDYLFPAYADENTKVFILCDGMGGHDNGEVASETVANTLGTYLTGVKLKGKELTPSLFEAGLAKAYKALDKIDTNSAKKPGTTMTCVCINDNGVLVAHIGDSRIYQIRPTEYNPKQGRYGIKFQTQDHSLVNDLLRAGELTQEEARDYPHKNIITRAMQPNLESPFRADIDILTDIRRGDYFFMCCDGILEQLTNEQLGTILANKELDDNGKLSMIKAVCDGKTRDNYTCWLIPIADAIISKAGNISFASENTIQAETAPDNKLSNADESVTQPVTLQVAVSKPSATNNNPTLFPAPRKNSKTWIYILLALVVAIIIFALGQKFGDKPKDSEDNTVPAEIEHEIQVKENEKDIPETGEQPQEFKGDKGQGHDSPSVNEKRKPENTNQKEVDKKTTDKNAEEKKEAEKQEDKDKHQLDVAPAPIHSDFNWNSKSTQETDPSTPNPPKE